MTDITDVLYRLRNMAGIAADDLRSAIGEAQAVLDKLDRFAEDAQDGAELIAASDLEPNTFASIPARSGLTRIAGGGQVHGVSGDRNGDPVCRCDWDPAALYLVSTREEARTLIRTHIRENTPPWTTDA